MTPYRQGIKATFHNYRFRESVRRRRRREIVRVPIAEFVG